MAERLRRQHRCNAEVTAIVEAKVDTMVEAMAGAPVARARMAEAIVETEAKGEAMAKVRRQRQR
jgi:hypothetical protein